MRHAIIALAIAGLATACDESSNTASGADATDDATAADPTDASRVDVTGDDGAPDDATAAPTDTAPADATPDVDGMAADTSGPAPYELTMGGWTMQPGDEATYCVVARIGNSEPIRVSRIRTSLSRGSHHLIVYKTDDAQEQRQPFPCRPFTETLSGATVPIVISQIREDAVELPEGVAYELEANQMVRIESHYLNYFPEAVTADVKVSFDLAPEGVATDKADILFYGTVSIFVAAGQTKTNPWSFEDVPPGLSIFAMTGHTHALGTNVEVERTTSSSTPGPAVYPPEGEPFQWDEAPVARFDPPLVFSDPGDGFRFRCTWVNTTDFDVKFGESATKEMCFFWAYYWPSQGPIIRF